MSTLNQVCLNVCSIIVTRNAESQRGEMVNHEMCSTECRKYFGSTVSVVVNENKPKKILEHVTKVAAAIRNSYPSPSVHTKSSIGLERQNASWDFFCWRYCGEESCSTVKS